MSNEEHHKRAVVNKDKCPRKHEHTPCPEGYVQWHNWAEEMGKTHKQIVCRGCGTFAIWTPK